jgi:signal transduction histidine kinase
LSIFRGIAVGNALIIIFGAVAGTLITLHLAGRTAEGWLMLLFASVGIALTLVVNSLIVRRMLRPLRSLRRQVDRLDPGHAHIDDGLLNARDDDIRQLARSVNAMAHTLADRNVRLRALSERSIAAQEAERKRIARSLHDDTIQALSTLIIGLDRLEQRAGPEGSGWQAELGAIRELATSSLQELRHIVYGLRPSLLDDLGLVAAIRSYTRATLEPLGVRVEVRGPTEDLRLEGDLGIGLYRIAQEAVSNVARHARARAVEVLLYERGERVWLEVVDDGLGFDVDAATRDAVASHRLGLLGMRERAELLGGEVRVASASGRGTRVVVSFPLQPLSGGAPKT